MSLEAAKIPNESNQNLKPNYQVQGDPPNVLCLITRMSSTQQVRGDPYVDQNPEQMCVDTYKN